MRLLRIVVPCSAVISAAAIACYSTAPSELGVCTDIGFASIVAHVRDQAGRPAGRATRLEIQDGSYRDVEIGTWDSVRVEAGNKRAGRYTVRVSRPGYAGVTLSRVDVPGDRCGAIAPVHVNVVLPLLPDAPPVRSVTITPPDAGFAPGYGIQYRAYVDAAPGLSTGVIWTVSDTLAATITADGLLKVKCSAPRVDFVVTARSIGDPQMFKQGRAGVMEGGTLCP